MKVFISIAVLVLVVVGIVIFATVDTNDTARNEGAGNETGGQGSNESISLEELITREGSHQCTFAHSTEEYETAGEVFISNGKLRGNYDTTVYEGGVNIRSYIINNGTTIYSWNNASAEGVQFPADAQGEGVAPNNVQTFDYDQELEYNCAPWSADEEEFVPPGSITFQQLMMVR